MKLKHQPTEPLKQTPHIVAFLDFLGAQEKMNAPDESGRFLEKINSIYHIADSLIDKDLDSMQLKIKIFSDNILVACEITDSQNSEDWIGAFLQVKLFCLSFQVCSALLGLWVRGGISCGNMFISEKFVYGHALTQAYKIESESAIYPRIVIDKQIFHKMNLDYQSLSLIDNYKSIDIDGDGEIYLLPFGQLFTVATRMNMSAALQIIKQDILEEYQKLTIAKHFKILPKYYWLASKFNDFCKEIQKEDCQISINGNGELISEDKK